MAFQRSEALQMPKTAFLVPAQPGDSWAQKPAEIAETESAMLNELRNDFMMVKPHLDTTVRV